MVETRNHLFDTLATDCDSWNVLASFCVHVDLAKLKVTCKSAVGVIGNCRSYQKYNQIRENILQDEYLIKNDIKHMTCTNINSLHPFYNPVQERVEHCTLLCIFSWQNNVEFVEYLLDFSGFPIIINKGARWELSERLDWILQYNTVLSYLVEGLGQKYLFMTPNYKHDINPKIKELLEKHGAETGGFKRGLRAYGSTRTGKMGRGGIRGGGSSGGALREEIFEENWGGLIEENIPDSLGGNRRKSKPKENKELKCIEIGQEDKDSK